jgi:hypothetical protein
MGAARDEGDIGAGMRQRRSKTTTHASGANHCNPHDLSPGSGLPGCGGPGVLSH